MERKLLNRLIIPGSSRIRIRIHIEYFIFLLNTDLELDKEKVTEKRIRIHLFSVYIKKSNMSTNNEIISFNGYEFG